MAEPKPSEITSRPPLVDFTRKDAAPPAPLYIDRDDRLYVSSWSFITTQIYIIRGDLLHADGIIRPFEYRHTPDVNGAQTFQVFTLAEGFLLSASVQPSSATTQHGLSFVELGILRGRGALGQQQKALLAGYVEGNRALSYPQARFEHFGEGRGNLRLFQTANPAAGAEMTVTVDPNQIWVVNALRLTLVTSATVIDRQPTLSYVQGGVLVWRSRAHDPQTASTTRVYNWARNGVYVQASILDEFQGILPEIPLITGNIISTVTSGLQVGDDFSIGNLSLEQWMRQL